MADYLIQDTSLTAIADAIRAKNGESAQYSPADMAEKIAAIKTTPALQSKSVTPGRTAQTVQPDSGYDGLSSVAVAGDSDLVAANIKSGVNIFGVLGTLSPGARVKTGEAILAATGPTFTVSPGFIPTIFGFVHNGMYSTPIACIRYEGTNYGLMMHNSNVIAVSGVSITSTTSETTVTRRSGYGDFYKERTIWWIAIA